jgi:acylphosphatase
MNTNQTPTLAQLREDAKRVRSISFEPFIRHAESVLLFRAAAALEAQADAMEARANDLHGWGVMRPDGTLAAYFSGDKDNALRWQDLATTLLSGIQYRVVPARLTTEGARAQEASE